MNHVLQKDLFTSHLWVPVWVCVLSHVRLFGASWTAARQASLSFTISLSLLELMLIKSMMSSNHLILCHPLLLPPPILPSIRVFSNESFLCIRWPKHWGFSISTSPSNESPRWISFRMDWFISLLSKGHPYKGDENSNYPDGWCEDYRMWCDRPHQHSYVKFC